MYKLQLTPNDQSGDIHSRVFRKHTIIRDPKTSENIAYGSVNLTSINGSMCNEEHQTLVVAGEDDGDDVGEDQPHPQYEAIHYNQLVD